jgi:ribosomal protein L35AE/L33A
MWIPTRVTVVMSLRGRVTTEAISYLIKIIEIAMKREALLAMGIYIGKVLLFSTHF